MFKNRRWSFSAILSRSWGAKLCAVERFFDRFHITDGLLVLALVMFGVGLGLVGRQALGSVEQDRIRQENRLLREQNQLYQDQFNELKKRVNTVEDLSKELSLVAGTTTHIVPESVDAIGGPEATAELSIIARLKASTALLEDQLRDLKLDFEREQMAQAAVPQGLPVDGLVTGRFGDRRSPFGEGFEYHTGLDIAANFGAPVRATADGLVIYSAAHSGYGNIVVIDHGNSITTRYGHLSIVSVRFGQRVRRGEIVGRAGSTGRSTGPHVHYEVRKENLPLNPLNYLSPSLPN